MEPGIKIVVKNQYGELLKGMEISPSTSEIEAIEKFKAEVDEYVATELTFKFKEGVQVKDTHELHNFDIDKIESIIVTVNNTKD